MDCPKCQYQCEPEFRFCPRCGALLPLADAPPSQPVIEQHELTTSLPSADTITFAAPLVGRQTQLETLRTCVRDVIDGRGGVISLIGEAGIGKSRLIAELKKEIKNAGGKSIPEENQRSSPLWLQGQALSYSATLPYWIWLGLIKDWLQSDETESAVKTRLKLQRQLEQLLGDQMTEVYPYLASLLSLQVEDEFTERLVHLDVQGLRTQTFLAIHSWLDHLAQTHPLIAVLEDLHWVDATSLSLLLYCMSLARSPLLFINTFEPEQASGCWQLRREGETMDRYTEVALDRLSPSESDILIQNLLLDEAPPPGLRVRVGAKAAGNPLFTEEVVRLLVEDGTLVHDPANQVWLTSASLDTLSIPDTLPDVISARVGLLPDESRRVLQGAAVVGVVFWERLVAQLSPFPVAEHLDHLQKAGFIRRGRQEPMLGSEYIFKHDLTKQAAYNSLAEARRPDYHHRVAAFIEVSFANHLEEYYGLLAYHAHQAADVVKAGYYARLTAERSADRYANKEAIKFYQQALALLDATDPQSRAPRFDLLQGLQEVYARIGQAQAREKALDEMLQLASLLADSNRLIEVYVNQATLYLGTDLELAENSARSALRLAQGMDNYNGEARALLQLAWVSRRLWRKRQAISQGMAALTASRRAGDRRLEGRVLCDLANFYAFSYDYEMALNRGLHALEISKAVGDRSTEAEARLAVTRNLRALGRYVEAIEETKETVSLARNIGDRRREASCLNSLGTAYADAGRYGEAIEAYQEALKLYHQIGDHIFESFVYGNIGWMHIRRGNYEAALNYFHSSRDAARRIENRSVEARALMSTVSLRRQVGQYAEAERLAQTARAIVPRAGWREIERWALGELSHIAWWRGDFAQALGLAQTALGHAYRQQDLQAIGWNSALLAAVHQGWPWFEGSPGRGSLELALRLAAQAEEIGRRTWDKSVQIWGARVLSLVYWRLDRQKEALEWNQRIIELLEVTPGYPLGREPLYFEHSLVLRTNGQEAQADSYLQRARIELMRKADLMDDPTMRRTFLEQVPVNRAAQGMAGNIVQR